MSEAPLIAIVDDDELARDGIRDLVESLGYAAATFTSAEHGSITVAGISNAGDSGHRIPKRKPPDSCAQ